MDKTTEIKKVSAKGLQFIANEEGCILHPYQDKVGVWTIGIGCTYYENGQRVRPSDGTISEGRALSLFGNVLSIYEMAVWSVTSDDINQNQFDALVSICYNIGVNAFKGSTLLKLVNANRHDPAIGKAFEMWKNAGGKPVLLARRKREAKLYFS